MSVNRLKTEQGLQHLGIRLERESIIMEKRYTSTIRDVNSLARQDKDLQHKSFSFRNSFLGCQYSQPKITQMSSSLDQPYPVTLRIFQRYTVSISQKSCIVLGMHQLQSASSQVQPSRIGYDLPRTIKTCICRPEASSSLVSIYQLYIS